MGLVLALVLAIVFPSFLDFVAFLARSIEKFGPENSLNFNISPHRPGHTRSTSSRDTNIIGFGADQRSEWAIAKRSVAGTEVFDAFIYIVFGYDVDGQHSVDFNSASNLSGGRYCRDRRQKTTLSRNIVWTHIGSC
jgi:hypothetical protein